MYLGPREIDASSACALNHRVAHKKPVIRLWRTTGFSCLRWTLAEQLTTVHAARRMLKRQTRGRGLLGSFLG